MTVQEFLSEAVRHHQAGQLEEAEKRYRMILAQVPEHPHALQLLGVIAHQAGQNQAAVELIQRAIALQSDVPEYYNNLGHALLPLGRISEAIAAYRTALRLKPGYAEAHNNLGNALKEHGQLEAAIAAYRAALELCTGYAEARNNLGLALGDQGRLEQAAAEIRTAISLKPDYAEAYNNLGVMARNLRRLDESIAAFRACIALRPVFAEAHNNLGVVLHDAGRLDEALAAYRTALQLRPEYADANANLGNTLAATGKLDEAVAAFNTALRLSPNNHETHNNLGSALHWQGKLDDAIAAYHTALRLKPDFLRALNNLGNSLKEQGALEDAIASFRQAITLHPGAVAPHDNLVLALHYHSDDAGAIAAEHRRWNEKHAEPLRAFFQPHSNERHPDRRLRVGYVSPDFREHAVARFLLPLFRCHDARQFEVFCYSDVVRPDATTAKIQAFAHVWHPTVGLSDQAVADIVRRDQVDILIDLAAHTAGNRLLVFARKPAPVQVTWLAYASSTGLDAIDYRLTDPHLDPPGTDTTTYAERSVTLPETYWCYSQPEIPIEPNALPALASGTLTFGALNNFCKVTPSILEVWAKLLRQTPGSRLILHAHPGSHQARLGAWLSARGVEPGRVVFFDRQPLPQYLAAYHQIDIVLDTFPYGGGTTTCDALWMGVPVISLAGGTAVSRAGASLLANVGLPDLVARSPDEYLRIARELGHNLPRLVELRATLRSRMQASPLMDASRFARNVEASFRSCWQNWCRQPFP